MLTRSQHKLLTFIADFTKANGWAPSYDEMRVAMGLASKSGINRLMVALIERGFIAKRFRNRARAIEVIRMPGDAIPVAQHEAATRGAAIAAIEGVTSHPGLVLAALDAAGLMLVRKP